MVDQKLLSGESLPVEKAEGDQVYAATVVTDGKLYLRAAKVGQETLAAKGIQLVRDAPVRETRVQNYAEPFADRMVQWSFVGGRVSLMFSRRASVAASLLRIDYGTGSRVAAPTTVLSSMTKAARQGILIKGGRYLEHLAEMNAIVFDKTGTLTFGAPEVIEIVHYTHGGLSRDMILQLAAAQQRLTHPVAEAIVRAARCRELKIPEGHTVAVVGDGINASPALAQANVGIPVHNGAGVAQETAHMVLLEDNLWKIPLAIDHRPRGHASHSAELGSRLLSACCSNRPRAAGYYQPCGGDPNQQWLGLARCHERTQAPDRG